MGPVYHHIFISLWSTGASLVMVGEEGCEERDGSTRERERAGEGTEAERVIKDKCF